MRAIYKKISLEPLKSRMPSTIPAYDNNGKQHDFLHIIELSNNPIMNYGMLPFDIQIINDDKLGEYSGKLYTYNQLVQKFHDLDNIFYQNSEICSDKIEINEHDNNFYNWLIENCFPYFLFNKELSSISNLNEIINYWNTNRLSITEVIYWINYLNKLSSKCSQNNENCCYCEEYNKRGGEQFLQALQKWYDIYIGRMICNVDDYGHDFIYSVKDTDTHVTVKVLQTDENNIKKITTHTFEIKEPRLKILGNNRYIIYGEIDKNGNLIKTINLEIIDNILTIPCLITNKLNPLIVSEPSISIPINLDINIDILGNTQSIIDEWESGYEYNKNIENQENINYDGGVVVHYNNENWILKSYENSPGYLYSTKYKEIYFANISGMTDDEYLNYSDADNELKSGYNTETQWEKFLNYLPTSNDLKLNTYSYKNNELIINPTQDIFSQKYYIHTSENGFCIINGIPYELITMEYVTINNVNYQVEYIYEYYNDNNILIKEKPYITVNNRKKYLDINNTCVQTNKYEIIEKLCYIINDNIKEYENDKEIIYNYAYINNTYVYISKDENNKYSVSGLTVDKYEIQTDENGDDYIIIYEDYIEYQCNVISGKTSSKLINLINNENLAIDNLGNKLQGVLPVSSYTVGDKTFYININDLKTNDWIFLPYTPNYLFDIEEVDNNVYWGDFISSITINYSHKNEMISSACTTINELKNLENVIHKNINEISNITCQIEYYIGTLLKKNNDNMYTLLKYGDDKYYGIKYVDNLSLTHEQCLYYYTEFDTSIINYLKLNPTIETYKNQTYNVSNISEEVSYFEFNIKPFDLQYGFIDYYDENSKFYKINALNNEVEFMYNNNLINCPIYFKNNHKYFSFQLNKNDALKEKYNYYCVKNNIKYYASYDSDKYTIKITDDEVYTASTNNNFNDNEGNYTGELPYEVYCEIPLKLYLLQVSNTYDTYFDYNNNMTLNPYMYDENKMGMATPEKISANIYIDRGTVRSIDYHLRLLECKSLESLEQIGNGFFNIISNN